MTGPRCRRGSARRDGGSGGVTGHWFRQLPLTGRYPKNFGRRAWVQDGRIGLGDDRRCHGPNGLLNVLGIELPPAARADPPGSSLGNPRSLQASASRATGVPHPCPGERFGGRSGRATGRGGPYRHSRSAKRLLQSRDAHKRPREIVAQAYRPTDRRVPGAATAPCATAFRLPTAGASRGDRRPPGRRITTEQSHHGHLRRRLHGHVQRHHPR